MIELCELTKRYGPVTAVDTLTCTVHQGQVTGFLGPNGAGKSTTMRLILGLDHPTAGTATVAGRRYVELPAPMRQVGALLDAGAVHPRRSSFHHLLALAQSNGIGRSRVDHVLGLVGLDTVADRRVGTFSLGMLQRLGLAVALLGDPPVLILDEPMNGLDPEGMRWMRALVRDLAAEGRAVLLSSHLMGEIGQTADRVIVIGQGRLIANTSINQLLRAGGRGAVLVRVAAADGEDFAQTLVSAGAAVDRIEDGAFAVSGLTSVDIGRMAAMQSVPLAELTPHRLSLEEIFLGLTAESAEYRTERIPKAAQREAAE
ncbi:MAG: ATP-binding cassette domain-containing protein [Bifidobacteriaceae bacterium]|nr:ATP-binding cassette domain-containing protein [Bifidobacteriaceae bacterium]